MINQADEQYLDLVREILDQKDENGNLKLEPTRTQFDAVKVFGKMMQFDLSDGTIPILTTKKISFKALVDEIIWIYVKGSNRIADLNSHIWDSWAFEDGTIGLAYGHEARHWGNPHNNNEIDQVEILLDKLKNNQQDRGMIVSLYNVCDLPLGGLRPCAFLTMWDVSDGHLNCTLIQRSGDVPVGVCWNMAQYGVLLHMFAHASGLKPGKLNHYINNAHIYQNQVEPIKTQLSREPYPAPKLWINPEVTDFNKFTVDDFKLINYKCHPAINMGEVAV